MQSSGKRRNWRASEARAKRSRIRDRSCDYTPKLYRARVIVGARSRPEHRYRPGARVGAYANRLDFCPDGFPFRCEKWRVRAIGPRGDTLLHGAPRHDTHRNLAAAPSIDFLFERDHAPSLAPLPRSSSAIPTPIIHSVL